MLNKIFNINEIKNSVMLQVIYYIFILNSVIYFFSFQVPKTCWPHFQSCLSYFTLLPLPISYSLNYLLVAIYGILIFGAFYMYRKEFVRALFLLSIILIVRIYFTFFGDYNSGNFNYYDVYLMFIYLALPKKELFLRIGFIWFYFLASTIKLDASFISGKYFTTLTLGAPFFNDIAVVIFSNLVIIMQMIGVWFIFSDNKKLRTLAYVYMTIFHFYSGIIVGYRYIITSIPFLIILFNEKIFERYNILKVLKIDKDKNYFGISFLLLLLCLQLLPYTIQGNHKITLEGNNYGFYMFEANHQCKSELFINSKSLKVEYSNDARNRCDPYIYLFKYQNKYKEMCLDKAKEKVEWVLTSSINGGPFYEVVDEKDLCTLTYKSFSKNSWIKDETNSKKVGYPQYNYYIQSYLTKNHKDNFISESKIINDNSLQNLTQKYLTQIQYIYWILWILTLIFLISKFFKKDR